MLDFSVDVAHWPAAALQQRVAITTGSYDHAVDGVALTLHSGRVALITSNDPEGLERAVRARVSDPTRVRVDGVEAGEEHVVEAAGPEVSDQRRVR